MKTFTFYKDKEYTHVERCSYSIQADSIDEARKIMLDAIENDNEKIYCNEDYVDYDYFSLDSSIAFYDENNNQIWWTIWIQ